MYVHNGRSKPNLRRKRKVLSGLVGLLAIVSLEELAKSVKVVHILRAGERGFQILGAATLRLQEPNEKRTNGRENRLVFLPYLTT